MTDDQTIRRALESAKEHGLVAGAVKSSAQGSLVVLTERMKSDAARVEHLEAAEKVAREKYVEWFDRAQEQQARIAELERERDAQCRLVSEYIIKCDTEAARADSLQAQVVKLREELDATKSALLVLQLNMPPVAYVQRIIVDV
jgi:chromosome segregation ATPase